MIEKPGRAAPEVIAEIVPHILRTFPWPKSMRWGARSAEPGSLTWVRPLHSILCVFGPETEETEVVDFEVGGIRSGNVTYGHRFMAPEPIEVRRFDDYVTKLEKAKVILDADRRKEMILADARNQALALGLELVEDEGLLEEVAGLVEWPVVLVGSFDEPFLDIPPEVIRTTIRANQKCFVLNRVKTPENVIARRIEGTRKTLANRFILSPTSRPATAARRSSPATSASSARGSPTPAISGSPISRRSSTSACPSSTTSSSTRSSARRASASKRIMRLAREIAPLVPADADLAERAAQLAKADLVTEMVGEFPELQGLMGRYYAQAQGRGPVRRDRHRGSLQAARARPTACRPIRSPSPSRSPTSSTRWSASGRSTRSRPARRTPMRCAARRSA